MPSKRSYRKIYNTDSFNRDNGNCELSDILKAAL